MPLEKISRKSVSDAVYDQLSAEIVEGRWTAGDALPAERELAQVLGVNRGAVREAMKRLVQAGLVQVRHGGGAKVLDYRRHAGMDLLSTLLVRADGTINLHAARGVMEMRAAIAPDVARRCAQRCSLARLEELEQVVERMVPERDPGELQTLALEFWQLLVDGSDNLAYQLAFNTLREVYEQIRDVLVHAMAAEVSNLEGHRLVVQAIRARDPEASAASAGALVRPGTEGILELLDLLQAELDAKTTPNDTETHP